MTDRISAFRTCISAFLDDRLVPHEFSRIYFDLSRMAATGLPADVYWVLNRGMHAAENYTDDPALVDGELIGEDELRSVISGVRDELVDKGSWSSCNP